MTDTPRPRKQPQHDFRVVEVLDDEKTFAELAEVPNTALGREWLEAEGHEINGRKVAVIDITGGPWIQKVETVSKTTLEPDAEPGDN